jgi:hypothetical protein
MSRLIAKFHATSITTAHLAGGVVKASAVMRGDRNASFATASPSGNLEMHVSEPELWWFLDQRSRAAQAHEARKERAAAIAAETGKEVPLPHAGVEVFIDLATTALDGKVVRLMQLIECPEGEHGSCVWESVRSDDAGGWTKLVIYISNPGAVRQVQAAKNAGQVEWFLALTASTDGFAGDGHSFRSSLYSKGVYGSDLCGECFGKPEDH